MRLAAVLLAVASLLSSGCLPGDRAKDLKVTSECVQPIWLRFYEEADATAEIFQNERPLRLDPGTTYDSSIFDNDTDGFSIAVSSSEGEVGKVIVVPHSEGDAVGVVLGGERCP